MESRQIAHSPLAREYVDHSVGAHCHRQQPGEEHHAADDHNGHDGQQLVHLVHCCAVTVPGLR